MGQDNELVHMLNRRNIIYERKCELTYTCS